MNRPDHLKFTGPIKTEDLEKLLDIAESLQEKCDLVARRIDILRIIQFSLILLATTIFLSRFIRVPHSEYDIYNSSTYISFFFLGIIYSFFMVICAQQMIRRIERRVLADQRALSEIVQLLRETESIVAEEERWSTLQRAQFRIRLSRFGAGGGDKSNYYARIRT